MFFYFIGFLVLWCQVSVPGPPACGANAHYGAAPPSMRFSKSLDAIFQIVLLFNYSLHKSYN